MRKFHSKVNIVNFACHSSKTHSYHDNTVCPVYFTINLDDQDNVILHSADSRKSLIIVMLELVRCERNNCYLTILCKIYLLYANQISMLKLLHFSILRHNLLYNGVKVQFVILMKWKWFKRMMKINDFMKIKF